VLDLLGFHLINTLDEVQVGQALARALANVGVGPVDYGAK